MEKEQGGYIVIFRASRTRKDGTVEYAKDQGLRGFPIRIPIRKQQ